MRVKELMTNGPACCTPSSDLREVARMLVENDCGAIPVVEDFQSRKPAGIVTDRDIACRAVARGMNALELTAGDCMSQPVLTVDEDADLDQCCRLMEANRVRRIVVVDSYGRCCGIVAQADIALTASEQKTAEVVRKVSQPTSSPSALS